MPLVTPPPSSVSTDGVTAFGDGTPGSPISAAASISSKSVKTYGAAGDGVTDDRAAILAAWSAATAAGLDLLLPPGTYKVSKYLDFVNGVGTKILGVGATLLYPSDDSSIPLDSVAVSDSMARAGILLRYCRNVSVIGLKLQGADDPAYDTINKGVAIYATHCTGTRITDCSARYGNTLFVQDTQNPTSGTGDSIAVSGGVVTLTDAAGLWKAGHVGASISLFGCVNETNNGVYVVSAVPSATQVQFVNAGAIAETSSFGWVVNDGDDNTVIDGCDLYGCRGALYTGNNSIITNTTFSIPVTKDRIGHAASYSISGSTVTLYDPSGPFTQSLIGQGLVGRYIKTSGSTSLGNDGIFKIASVVSAFKITYTNASGVTESIPSTATWWIPGGERAGIGAGAGALSLSGSIVTLTTSANMFSSADVNRIVRIANATTAGNNGSFLIASVPAANQVTFTNISGASESYTGMVSVDAWDNHGPAGSAFGSTQSIYLFAGRSNIKVLGCTFKGIRKSCVKVSGSALPVRSIEIANCHAEDCGAFALLGADDSQEHTDLSIHDNTLIDIGTQRLGWSEGFIVEVIGSRGVRISDNAIHFTHDSIAVVDGRSGGVAGFIGINAERYAAGISQPIEDVQIVGNKFTADPLTTIATSLLATAIKTLQIGINSRYNTGATLAISGSTVTLTDPNAEFPQALVGQSITLVNAPNAGNNGTFTVTAVGNGTGTNQTTLQFTNASGVGGGVSAGTYRVTPRRGVGGLLIEGNEIYHCATTGILSLSCVGPEVRGNVFSGLLVDISFQGDVTPRVCDNRELGASTQNARIRLNSGTAWPIVQDNTITNNAIGSSSARDFGIGVDSGTAVDYPLLGKTVRMLPTGAQEEVVVAYGSLHVDGDTITINAVPYTYKASGPTGSQFNSFAGLVALIDAQTGIDCADYGASFAAGAVTTQHLRIRRNVTSTSDGGITVSVATLNPTALVLLRDSNGGNTSCLSRGSGSAGPVPDKVVAWSPMARFTGAVTVAPDNTDARTILQTNGPALPLKNGNNSGCCELINVGDCTGKTPEFRAVFH